MGKMVEGEWKTEWYQPDDDGNFVRPDTVFRDRVKADGSSRFEPEAGRYHLYIARACPWAHRTVLMRHFKGLDDAIEMSIVHPFMGEDGWHFDASEPDATEDRLFGSDYLRQVYRRASDTYTGRVTVPVLWDTKHDTIVNNESKEIIRMFDHEFAPIANDRDLAPADLVEEVDAVIEMIYEPVNNGVYRAGFASSQKAYESAVNELFEMLDRLEERLEGQRYLCGDHLTEADICLFTTLVRFDPVYYTHFKCNVRRIRDFPNLWRHTCEFYQLDGVEETVNLDHIKRHYFESHETINPKRIVPVGPDIEYVV